MPTSKKSKPASKAHSAKPAPAKKPAPQRKPVSAPKAKSPPAHHANPKARGASAEPKTPPAAKPAPAKQQHPPAKAAPKASPPEAGAPAATGPVPKIPPASGKNSAKSDALRARLLERRTLKPIAFTLDEAREVAKTNVGRAGAPNGDGRSGPGGSRNQVSEVEERMKKAAQPHHVQPASLADILGYNPAVQPQPGTPKTEEVDPRFQRYHRLLIELRDHVLNGLNTHAEETLKRSAKDDSGDLSGYAQHMADAGTDTFDRDFALSLVSNEQEALAEIEAALERIEAGTFGICELTGKPINKERLLAVPFARYSVESQVEVERTKRRAAQRAGLFGEGEEGGKIEDDSGGEE